MQRYFSTLAQGNDPHGQKELRQLHLHIDGEWRPSATDSYRDCFNPSTGNVIARLPQCTIAEMDEAVASAKAAFPAWSRKPVGTRAQVLFRMKALIDENINELTILLCMEQGKTISESRGDILKALEVIEFACGMPHLMKGESILNVSEGYDTVQYREPLGVFLGLVPWNFPTMIPHGWMIPICIAAGNTFVLKAASNAPQSAMRMLELWTEAGLPKGVVNLITANPRDVDHLLSHPDIVGVSFVGSSTIGAEVYSKAATAGKRVQVLGEAKNHALVMADCKLERSADGIINAFCGCAGERCMALPTLAVEEKIADQLVELLLRKAKSLRLGLAYAKETALGPVVNAKHKESVEEWIAKGISEGAELVLDGRNPTGLPPECKEGFFLGPTIFDKVTQEMAVGREEIFGPVLSVKRVSDFEHGLAVMNASEFANGSVIFTQSGSAAREFARRTHGGMVGVNVGIPVPMCIFGFTGHKRSFFGDLHVMGMDGVRFYTELKNVTSTWFVEAANTKVDTWDGMLGDRGR
jgi:malonate-semialdehyde dehydrogenase (acetylating)/methylmalonate-semialdehyde dehydrogenase